MSCSCFCLVVALFTVVAVLCSQYHLVLSQVKDRQVATVVLTLLIRRCERLPPGHAPMLPQERAGNQALRITRDEYSRVMRALHVTGYQRGALIDVAFDLFDTDGTGNLEASEFRRFVHVVTGVQPTKQQLVEMMQKFDSNNDGKVSKDELLSAVNEAFPPFRVQASVTVGHPHAPSADCGQQCWQNYPGPLEIPFDRHR